jgi:hypothetical protein
MTLKTICPECGTPGNAGDDCHQAACPKCHRVYIIAQCLAPGDDWDEDLMDQDLEDQLEELLNGQ